MLNVAPIGHNLPPSDLEIVQQRLADREREIAAKIQIIVMTPAPETIADEAQAGAVTDTIKALGGAVKSVEDSHKTVKAPYLECGKAVDAWKNRMIADVDKRKAEYGKPLTAYLEAKAAAERARQLEQARIERERAEALAAEAAAHEEAGINDTAAELIDAAASTETLAAHIQNAAETAKPSELAKARSFTGASASQKLTWVGEIESRAIIDLDKLRQYFSDDALKIAVNAFVRDGGRELPGVKIYQKATLAVR